MDFNPVLLCMFLAQKIRLEIILFSIVADFTRPIPPFPCFVNSYLFNNMYTSGKTLTLIRMISNCIFANADVNIVGLAGGI